VPTDPYNPLPATAHSHDGTETINHPSPYVPIRLPIFRLVLWLNDAIVKVLSVGSGGSTGRRHNSSRSEEIDHETVEMGAIGNALHTGRESQRPTRGITDRVRIGGRRKMD
jgi:etoposide-induced 2.4 mRNA